MQFPPGGYPEQELLVLVVVIVNVLWEDVFVVDDAL
jgi:hypothetical protein